MRLTVGLLRAVLPVVVVVPLAVGCGDENGPVAAVPVSAPMSTVSATAAATPGGERCEALAAFVAAAPPSVRRR